MKRYTFTIMTRYHGPTDTKGARISARFTIGNLKTVFIPYPYELVGIDAHQQAANALLEKHNLSNPTTHYAESKRGYLFFYE